MIATIKRPCPRCPHPIEPGQVMVPMPLGWTHAGCVEAADSAQKKGKRAADVRCAGGGECENGATSKDGPGDSLRQQRAEVPGPRPTLTRSAEL